MIDLTYQLAFFEHFERRHGANLVFRSNILNKQSKTIREEHSTADIAW